METAIATTQAQSQAVNLFDPKQFETLQRVCSIFTHSELVPKMYRISADNSKEKALANCMIAVNMAQRLGADPLMVMQNMYIVHGQPAWSAKFLTATVNSCGRFNPMKYRVEAIGKVKFGQAEIDNVRCIAYTTEKGSDEVLESAPVTIEMAIKEGWYGKNGSKWQTMPQLMLQYRAVTFWTRAYAPELSMGMRTEDELQDITDIPYEDVSERVAKEKSESANKEILSMEVEAEVVQAEPVKGAEKEVKPTPKEKVNAELFEPNGTAPATNPAEKPGF